MKEGLRGSERRVNGSMGLGCLRNVGKIVSAKAEVKADWSEKRQMNQKEW